MVGGRERNRKNVFVVRKTELGLRADRGQLGGTLYLLGHPTLNAKGLEPTERGIPDPSNIPLIFL